MSTKYAAARSHHPSLDRLRAELERGPRPHLAWKHGARSGLQAHARRVAFLEWQSGTYHAEAHWTAHRFHRREDLAGILALLVTRDELPDTLYLTGPNLATHRPPKDWYAAAVEYGWALSDWRTGEHSCYLAKGGRRVQLRMASEWFGPETDAERCRDAWRALRGAITRMYGPESYLYPSPTETGLYLAEMVLPYQHTYPVLPDGLRGFLARNSPQGRVEVVTPAGREMLPRLVSLDARWQYAACVRHLPAGPWMLDATDRYAEHVPGFYWLTARVPAGWPHVGLLPLRQDGRTVYPSRPGKAFLTFATGAEVELAMQFGWVKRIQYRLLWPEWEQHGDPLKGHISRLRELRERAEAHSHDPRAPLLRNAYRELLIRPIGAFHSRTRRIEGVCSREDLAQIPAGAIVHPRGDALEWELETERVSARSHPEWSATIWGRARTRLAKAALGLGRDSLVALRTDAIWLDHDPGWEDSKQPGAWRVKDDIAGPLTAPHTQQDMLDLLWGLRMHDEEETAWLANA